MRRSSVVFAELTVGFPCTRALDNSVNNAVAATSDDCCDVIAVSGFFRLHVIVFAAVEAARRWAMYNNFFTNTVENYKAVLWVASTAVIRCDW